jgi:hypothetical protein
VIEQTGEAIQQKIVMMQNQPPPPDPKVEAAQMPGASPMFEENRTGSGMSLTLDVLKVGEPNVRGQLPFQT